MRVKTMWCQLVAVAVVLTVGVDLVLAQGASPLAGILATVEKASLDKSAAERLLTEKNVALKSFSSTIEALNEFLKKAQENKLAAERVGAAEAKANAEKTIADLEEQLKTAKAAVEKAAKDQAAAAKMVQERTAAVNEANKQLTAQKTPLVKMATEASKANFDATEARERAASVLNKKLAATNQAATVAATSQAAAAKLAAEKAATEKALIDKNNAAKTVTAGLAASQAAAEKAAAERSNAEKALAGKIAAAKAATDKAAAAKAAADKTAAEKIALEKALAEKTAAAKTAAAQASAEKDAAKKKALEEAAAKIAAERNTLEKALAEKTTALKTATDGAAAAQTAAAKENEGKVASEKALAALTGAAKAAAEKVPPAKAAIDKLAAEKGTLEKLLQEKITALKGAEAKAATDKAAADKALAEKNEADNVLKTKIVAEKSLRHRAAEARAIADGGLKLIGETSWDLAKARHLLVRAGFGGTPEQVQQLYEMGLIEAVNSLVDYHYTPADEIPFHIEPPERPAPYENLLSPQERDRLNQRRDNKRNQDYYRLRTWWMRRLVESPRPLQEKLVLFWHGHFVSEWQKIAWAHLMYQQNQLFRDHAGGNFGGLVYGIVHDPCMIVYLDNQVNYKGRPNQNLARELMELFTLGVNQGYTEYDIREGARALTGYTYEHYTGQFRFNLAQHDTDPKTLFGQTGPWTGDDFCTLILQQPHTARFIAGKLFEYFAYPDPDPKVVAQLATVLRGNGYEMAPLLKNIFMSEEFYSAKAVGTQIKSPVQLMVGLARDFGVKGADYNYLFQVCADMGQELFQPPNVKGWYGGRDWINANLIFTRYNHTANFIRSVPQPNKGPGIDLVAYLEGKNCTTAAQVVDYLAKACLATPLNEEQRRDLTEYLGQLPPPAEWAKQKDQLNAKFRQVLVLLLTTPDAQIS